MATGGNELIALRRRVAGRTADRPRLPVAGGRSFPFRPPSEVFVVPNESRAPIARSFVGKDGTWKRGERDGSPRASSRKIFIVSVVIRNARERTKGSKTAPFLKFLATPPIRSD